MPIESVGEQIERLIRKFGITEEEINDRAGKVWKNRGGGQSTLPQQDGDWTTAIIELIRKRERESQKKP